MGESIFRDRIASAKFSKSRSLLRKNVRTGIGAAAGGAAITAGGVGMATVAAFAGGTLVGAGVAATGVTVAGAGIKIARKNRARISLLDRAAAMKRKSVKRVARKQSASKAKSKSDGIRDAYTTKSGTFVPAKALTAKQRAPRRRR